MKEIPLTQGKVALVDDEDFEWLMQWKWLAFKIRDTFTVNYVAARQTSRKEGSKWIFMHRLILGNPECVDHKDRNRLNNQRSNLRECTNGQNQMNRGTRIDRYKSVWFAKHAKKWTSQISVNKKRVHLGYFDYSTDAAIAYNNAALKYYGEFAALNQIPE